jgi:hypothetical protein
MRKGCVAASAPLLLLLVTAALSQSLVGWVEPERQRIAVVNNTATEQRQVRFTDGWESAD